MKKVIFYLYGKIQEVVLMSQENSLAEQNHCSERGVDEIVHESRLDSKLPKLKVPDMDLDCTIH